LKLVGDRVTPGAVAVPDRAMVCVPVLSTMLTVPVRVPAAVGAKTI
jgi:hypothetical protein